MGKPFKQELALLEATYKFALELDIDRFINFVKMSRALSLVSIGSGGSLTSALYASQLHNKKYKLSTFTTPLEFMASENIIHDSSILFVTASGRNYDILNSYRFAVENEPPCLAVLCASVHSRIEELSKKTCYTTLFDFSLPCGKDGFLATNSLIAFNTILHRAYNKSKLPDTLESLVHPKKTQNRFLEEFRKEITPLLKKNTYSVLFGEWGKSAAYDLESKFSEAALGNVQLADFRNFGHGRHNWLDKKGKDTAIIAFISPEDEKIAQRTLSIIPKEIPVLRIQTANSGSSSSLDFLIKTMFIVDTIGAYKCIDPGKPRVARFGIQMYNIRLPFKLFKIDGLSTLESAAVIRKLRTLPNEFENENIENWKNHFRAFLINLKNARFGSLVLDYDGTICEPSNRYKGISPEVGVLLKILLQKGTLVGIATGRGKSVREDLQRLIPQEYWSNVIIGYYNGSDIGTLCDNSHPDKSAGVDPTLEALMFSIEGQQKSIGIEVCDVRPRQISFEPNKFTTIERLMWHIRCLAEMTNLYGLQILESSHSIDVLAPGVTKTNLVKEVSERRETISSTLCIGDKGKWPGNDFALLSTPYSLSVDTVSPATNTCWNLAPLGIRGVQAALCYLRAIEFDAKGLMQFNYSKLRVK